jgi:hypothetical protein
LTRAAAADVALRTLSLAAGAATGSACGAGLGCRSTGALGAAATGATGRSLTTAGGGFAGAGAAAGAAFGSAVAGVERAAGEVCELPPGCTGPISTTPPHLGHLALGAVKVAGTRNEFLHAVHVP